MLLRKGGEVTKDPWVRVGDDDPLPQFGDIIISFDRLVELSDASESRQGRVGVFLANDFEVVKLAELISSVDLVCLDFPKFADGRAYSQAWQIRDRFGFKGEIRATGEVLPDQLAFMHRAGFDSFEISGNANVDVMKAALATMSHAYQQGYGEDLSSLRRQFRLTS